MSRQRILLAATIVTILIPSLTACVSRESAPVVPAAQNQAAAAALDWLRGQQKENGSFDAGFGHPAGLTCDAVLALVAAGEDPAKWRTGSGKPSTIDYLLSSAHEYAVDAATTGKLVVALAAAGKDPSAFGQDWLALLRSFASDGAYDPGSVGQAWAILALKAAGHTVPASPTEVLEGYQLDSGAWASAFGPDNDTVAYVVQALAAAGERADTPALQRALAFFREQQNGDGGFPAIKPSEWGTDSNANSTANVIMALVALGEDPTAEAWTRSGGNPISSLLALQAQDGRVEFQRGVGEPLLSTVQAIPAFMNTSLPGMSK